MAIIKVDFDRFAKRSSEGYQGMPTLRMGPTLICRGVGAMPANPERTRLGSEFPVILRYVRALGSI